MKNIRAKIEGLGAAVAFAEAGEVETALTFLHDKTSNEKASMNTASKHTVSASPGFMQKLSQKLESISTAIAFAEAGERETALEFLGGESYVAERQAAKEAGLTVQKTTSSRLAEKIGKVAEAVAFAEAGEHEHARTLMGEKALQEKEKGRILVVGREYSFSDHLMAYATNMAKRMRRDIVALNVTASDVGFTFLSAYHKTVKEDFQRHAAENAEVFKKKAAAEGVEFEHVIRFGDPDRAIRSLCEEIGKITYALAEPEISESKRPADVDDQWEIPVFCIVPQAA